MTAPQTILAFDTGSSTLSVALLAEGREHRAEEPQSRSSTQLPQLVERLLDDAALTWRDLEAVVAARGPGSFTGLRVGLAFALGLHQALGVAATAVPTLELLARGCDRNAPVTAAVHAWRGCWFAQSFTAPPRRAADEPLRLAPGEVAECGEPLVIDRPVEELSRAVVSDRSIAAVAAALAQRGELDWRSEYLTSPLYLAPPPARTPSSRSPETARADGSAAS